jgi:hypothetical protein
MPPAKFVFSSSSFSCHYPLSLIFDKNVANKKAHNKAQGVDSKKQQEEFKQGWIIARNYQE